MPLPSLSLLNARSARLNFSLGLCFGTLLALFGVGGPAVAQTATGGGLTLDGNASNESKSSTATVAATGTVDTVKVVLNGVQTNDPACVLCNGFSLYFTTFILEAPDGTKMVLLGSTGDGTDGIGDSGLWGNPATITIQDGNGTAPFDSDWPNGPSVVEPSSYWFDNNGEIPSSVVTNNLPQTDGSHESGGNKTLNGVFSGHAVNGTWTLIAMQSDDDNSYVTISGWQLYLTYTASAAANTTTTVSPNPNHVIEGSPITFTATVSSTSTVNFGTVTFTSNGNNLSCSGGNPVAVSNGTATCTTSSLSAQGLYTVEADYSGVSGTYLVSSGSADALVEAPADKVSTTEWCNQSPMTVPGGDVGSVYPSIISVSGLSGSVGNVEVELNGFSQNGSTAQHLLVAPSGGTYNLDFLDEAWIYQTSSSVNLDILDSAGQYPSGNSPTSGSYDPYDGEGIASTFPSATAPSLDTSIPQVPAQANIHFPYSWGSVNTTFESSFNGASPNGDWALYAYNPTGTSETISNWCLVFTLNSGDSTATTVTSTKNGVDKALVGQSVTLTAKVTDTANGSNVPTGTVTFLENGVAPAGTTGGDNVVTLVNGQATFTTSSLAEGDHEIVADYTPLSGFNESEGSLVQRIDHSTTFSSSGGGANPTISACNTGGVNSTQGVSGAFTPNPSNIFVSGLPGTVQSVTVSLNGLYANSDDTIQETESMLEGPTGGALDFFSDTGTGTFGPYSGLNLVFSDSASNEVPQTSFGSGTYKPTSDSKGTDSYFSSSSGFYPSPGSFDYAGSRGTSTLSSEFQGTNGNGTWSLFWNIPEKASQEGVANGWCLNFTETAPTVTVSADHSPGDFPQGASNQQITVSVDNNGTTGPTGDPVGNNPLTVTDTLNAAFTFAGVYSGTGWTCSGTTTVTCSNDSAVAQGSNYPELTIDVNVSPGAPGSQVSNSVSVSGAGVQTTGSNTDTISIVIPPNITSAASTTFKVGVAGTFTVTATGYPAPTFSETGALPNGVTLASNGALSGTPTLGTQGSYPITITASNGVGTDSTQDFTLTVNGPDSLVVNTDGDDAAPGTPSDCTPNPSTSGPGSCTLRDALAESASLGAASIAFDSTVFTSASTITLTSGVLSIPPNTAITGITSGSGASLTNLITVSGGNSSGVFSMGTGVASIGNVNITGGHAGGSGGGINNNGGTLTVAGSTISDNIALSGGGIYTTGGALTVKDSTFGTNLATDGGGGGIYINGGTVNVSYSTFNNNSTTSAGGGAIWNEAGTVTITNSTVSGNTGAGGPGGGINNQAGTATLSNSIVAGNTAASDADAAGAFTTGGHNLIGDGTGMSGITNGANGDQVGTTGSQINPLLASLGSYGGPTQTMVPLPSSTAICGGAQAAIPSGVTLDQRGAANTNATYSGYSAGSPCVDTGAVQTAYALAFTTEPPLVFTTGAAISPAPVVGLTENTLAATLPTNTITVTDADSALTGASTTTASLSSGSASFGNLIVGSNVSGDTLTATMALTSSITLTTGNSSSFSSTTPVLSIAKTHTGNFIQGQTAEWDVTVSNSASGTTTTAPITVSDTLPTGYTLSSYSSTGSDYTCTGTGTAAVSCTTSSVIAGGGSLTIQLMVAVPLNSPTSVSNTALAWGGGDVTHTSQGTAASGTDANVPVSQVPASLTINGSSTQSAAAGTAFGSLAVTVKDANGVPIPNYNGVVFTATTGSHGGTGTFASNGTGTVSIATDSSGIADPGTFTANTIADSYSVGVAVNGLTATFNLTNTAGAFNGFQFSNVPPQAFTGWPIYVTVTAVDQYGNTVTTFPDTVQVTSSDAAATLPPNSTLSNGSGTFFATLNTVGGGTQTFTVTDTTNTSIFATTSPIIVTATPNLVVTTAADGAADETQCTPQSTPGTGSDAGCSLRDALNYSSSFGAANVSFDTTKVGASPTITLTNGVLEIPNNTGITGPNTGSVTVSGNNLSGVFQMTDPNAQGALTNLAITGGMVNDTTSNPSVGGAGIYNDGLLTVSNCTISGNQASSTSVEVDGGGIFSDNDLEISNSTITGNTATSGGAAIGGGIYNASYVDANHISVSGNSAKVTAGGTFAFGGGILGGEIDLTNSTVSGNSAQGPSGGSTTEEGGGIFADGPTHIEYSTIAGNSVTTGGNGAGGGIYAIYKQNEKNTTISGNTANDGGGMFLAPSITAKLANTILSGNTATTNTDFDNQGTLTDQGGNLIGTGGINLTALGNYSGPTQTMLPLPGSPAICDGLVVNIPSGVTMDQRGLPNTNTTYPGYSSTACVDSGAVQTNYALAFSQQPSTSLITANVLAGAPIAPAPAVSVTESGTPIGGATVTMAASEGTLNGTTSETATGGTATFYGISIAQQETNDTLIATLPLNPNLSTPLSITTQSYAFNLPQSAPGLTNPTPGSTLTSSNVTFNWSSGSGVTAYQLRIGSELYGDDSQDVYASPVLTGTSVNVTVMPTNGERLYVRLYYEMGGVWNYVGYKYVASGTPAPPVLDMPAGTTLTGANVTFGWTAGSGVTRYQLRIGDSRYGAGSEDLYASGPITSLSVPVTGLPTNSEPLYVRLYYEIAGDWNYTETTYYASGTTAAPVLTSPTPTSTLSGASVTFGWTAGTGVTSYQLRIGNGGVGASSDNIFASGPITTTSVGVTGLPTDGSTVYVRLYYEIDGVWKYTLYTYTAQ